MTQYLNTQYKIETPIKVDGGGEILDVFYPAREFGDWFDEEMFSLAGKHFPDANMLTLDDDEVDGGAYVFYTGSKDKATEAVLALGLEGRK